MRFIEFRAWDKVTKHYWHLNLSNMVFEYSKTGDGRHVLRLSAIEVFNNSDRFVAEQYTGLHDKNGKKIFEGGIVKYVDFAKRTNYLRVGYSEEDACFYTGGIRIDYATREGIVVGNIHENPNLLGASK